MIKERTVLVVGAGASFEADLPLGDDLTLRVAQRLASTANGIAGRGDDNDILCAAMGEEATRLGINHDDLALACQKAERGLKHSTSIDAFLHTHADDRALQLCGKLAIAQIILAAEHESRLSRHADKGVRPHHGLRDEGTWFRVLFRLLHNSVRKGQEAAIFSGLSIVCFNYDRCIEYYLWNALMDYYALNGGQSAALLRTLRITHPYGTVGDLSDVGFGARPDSKQLIASASRIRTFNEELHDETQIRMVKEWIWQARDVVFLGFGFHNQNMELLSIPHRETPDRSVAYATMFEASQVQQGIFHGRIVSSIYPKVVNRSLLTCHQFLKEDGLIFQR
jgi:hypothetical protein